MVNRISISDQLSAPLVFDKHILEEVAREKYTTSTAIGIITVGVIIEEIAFIFDKSIIRNLFPIAGMVDNIFLRIIFVIFLYVTLITYLSVGIKYAIWIFGGNIDILSVIKLYAFSSQWLILATITNMMGAPALSTLFILLMILVFASGLGTRGSSAAWVTLMAIVLGILICFLFFVYAVRFLLWISVKFI